MVGAQKGILFAGVSLLGFAAIPDLGIMPKVRLTISPGACGRLFVHEWGWAKEHQAMGRTTQLKLQRASDLDVVAT